MAELRVKFLGFLARLYGSDEANLKFDGDLRLRDLLKGLTERKRRLRMALFDEKGELRWNILILVNRRELSTLEGLDTRLSDGDEVVLAPVSHGG